jgi:diketogulonate reductase-like aldo/keto reductase
MYSPDITIPPCINQVELNFWNPQPDLVEWSKEHGIQLQAYSPFGGTGSVAKSLKDVEVRVFALTCDSGMSLALYITPDKENR